MQSLLELVEDETDRLLAFIRSRVASDEDSWDIMQEVFQALWARRSLGEVFENALAWVFRVARNKIVDYYRRQRARPETSLEGMLENGYAEEIFELADSAGETPEEQALRQELRETLLAAIRELPEEQREIFVLTELEGMKYREIAEETGMSINTLLSRKRYAVLKLRESLEHVQQRTER